jgi:AcrR family transcriptional regulator
MRSSAEFTALQERWIEAGLAQLAGGGVGSVRIEALAKNLGVTKGGFYWVFTVRPALLHAFVAQWQRGRVETLERQVQEAGGDARARLLGLLKRYSHGVNPQGMAIEMAMRQWAYRDAEAAQAVAVVDAARLEMVRSLYAACGLSPDEAEARAFLFYCFVFGQSLLFLPGSASAKRRLLASSIEQIAAVGSETPNPEVLVKRRRGGPRP